MEHGIAAGEIGDNLTLLTAEQQERHIHQPQNSSSVSCLARLLADEDAEKLPFLSVVGDEQPRRLLEVTDGCLFYQGELIGTLVLRTNGLKDAPDRPAKIQSFCRLQVHYRSRLPSTY